MKNWENKKSKELFKVITSLKTEKETRNFLRDLLTEQEIIEFSNRWKAAQMLDEKISYAKISEVTGLSSRTVARVSKWLNFGMGGYKKMVNELHHSNSPLGRGLS